MNNISLNGQPQNSITVLPGARVSLTLDFEIRNQADCPGCISQLIFWLNTTAIECIYNGVPNTCPAATAGNFSHSFSAPITPGSYTLQWKFVQAFGCEEAKDSFSVGARSFFATLIVSGSTQAFSSIHEENDLELTLQPNPAKEIASIRFSNILPAQYRFSVLNLHGMEIESRSETFSNTGSQELLFNTSNLKNGVYLMRMIDQLGISKTIRFMVSK